MIKEVGKWEGMRGRNWEVGVLNGNGRYVMESSLILATGVMSKRRGWEW